MRTLNGRLILSHLLPLFIILSFVGFSLDYILETRFLLTNIGGKLTGEAVLLAGLIGDQPEIWNDTKLAQAFVERVSLPLTAEVMIINKEGILLASSYPADVAAIGQRVSDLASLNDALAGEVMVNTDFSRSQQADVVEVLVPAWGVNRQIMGAIRLTQRLENVYEQFLTLRYFIGGITVIGLLIGGGIALGLGKSLSGSLQEVTDAVHRVSRQETLTPLPEQGPQEIRQLLKSVNTLVERLQTLEQNRRKLLANLVHELSNPLSALHSATNALLRGADTDHTLRKELLQGMQKEEIRLERLLADLSGLYDRLLGGLELHYSPVNLNQLLPQMLAPWREAAVNKGLQWHIYLPDLLPQIVADEDRLSQVLNNLLNNAIKYTPVNGSVSISAGSKNEEVWIQVSDTGPGISSDERHHIFTPFYRGTANRRFADGMGLGLSIAQDLVRAHNGRLQLSSTPGHGSQFTIWLPISGSKT